MSCTTKIFFVGTLSLCIPLIWIGSLLNRSTPVNHNFVATRGAMRGEDKVNMTGTRTGIDSRKPCYKVVYTWLDERDEFHVKLLFKKVGRFSCPDLSCGVQIEHGRNLTELAASDVVFLFYKHKWDWQAVLKHQSDRQKWVFWTSESPRHIPPRRIIPPQEYSNRTYDYIMSFRKGASNEDAYLSEGGYGHFDRTRPSVQKDDNRNWAENKTKLVAWVASNCYTGSLSYDRTGFVNALARHIRVDTFGHCGSRPCKDIATCGLQKYRFYLALENSECQDYITEKFWYNSLTLGLVPIVFGAPKENYLREAPPNSFIFIPDFPSIAKLAAYLVELSENDDLYNRYFQWKKEGSVESFLQYSNFEPESLCRNVVRRVLKDEQIESDKKERKHVREPVVDDWDKWWTKSCKYTVTGYPIPDS
ncbi:alpha-(1,3)-fucosyltransferase 7-like [Lytechinus variegatus]|uniref:alpha-(1,3)-fucosyltransferase 7-like n=1 Tax=Lytechinus variegatus TaxID=7654 RepID=UPI001BB27C58|nr:alpha-(1,3)-fucosyltransferase 7-like [Lytechinus variegatus]